MAGQPSPIDRVIGYRDTPDGQVEVTVSSRIVAAIRTGVPLFEAADAAGVGRDTVRGWIRVAGKAEIRARGHLEDADLTDHEARCIGFSADVREARATWLVDAMTLHERVARGGLPVEVVTIERGPSTLGPNGEVVPGLELKRSTRTAFTLPSERALEWRLKYLRPDLFADRLEISGPGGGPIDLSQEDRASALSELVQRFKVGKKSEEPAKPRRPRPKKETIPDEPDPAV